MNDLRDIPERSTASASIPSHLSVFLKSFLEEFDPLSDVSVVQMKIFSGLDLTVVSLPLIQTELDTDLALKPGVEAEQTAFPKCFRFWASGGISSMDIIHKLRGRFV